MVDRSFTEVDLRRMLKVATILRRDIVPGRWVAATRHRRQSREIIIEPELNARLLVVITAYRVQK
jgi:hypothetical protein